MRPENGPESPVTHAKPGPSSPRNWPSLVGVLCAVGAVTSATFGNAFVHDDLEMIRAGIIHEPARIPSLFGSHTLALHGDSAVAALDTYRPVSALSFFWDAWLSGSETWSYHLTNWALHLATVALVFALLRRLVPAPAWVSPLFALLFGLSPQLVEAHGWINGRSDVLAGLFGVAALLAADSAAARERSMKGALGIGVLAGLSFLCGLLSKEPLLLVLPVLFFWPFELRAPWRVLPLVVATGLYLALRTAALGGFAGASGTAHVTRALTHLPILLGDGALELLAPHRLVQRNLREDYAAVPGWAALTLGLAWLLLALATLRARRRLPVVLFGLSLFVATLAPAALISAHDVRWPGFGRYLYLPAIGFWVAMASLAASYGPRLLARARGLSLALTGSYVVLFALGTLRYERAYADNDTLHAAALRAQPESAAAHAGVASVHVSAGRHAEALAAYRRALALDPAQPSYALQVAFFALQTGDPALAAHTCQDAIERLPSQEAALFHPLLVRALVGHDGKAALAALCECLAQPDAAPRCETVARSLVAAGPRYRAALEAALPDLPARCPSADTRTRILRLLGG